MPVHNIEIAAIFDEIADLLEIEKANPFRIRAYRNASRTLQGLGDEAKTLLDRGEDLTELSGIGKDLAGKIEEIVETGRCLTLEKLRKSSAPGLLELLKIPGLGPKRVHALYHELDIHTPEQLLRAAQDGRLRHLAGFGEKTEARILEALTIHVQQDTRIKRTVAAQYARPLVEYLQHAKGVKQVTVAGSFRRCMETVGDLDILISAAHSQPVMEQFVAYDEIIEVLSKGNTRATVILRSGLQVDVRVVRRASYGAALHYFTGSKAHNIAIRRRARQRGCFLEINAQPERLDLVDSHCMLAKEEGVLMSINSDAHSIQDFDNLEHGAGQARRGWLEKKGTHSNVIK